MSGARRGEARSLLNLCTTAALVGVVLWILLRERERVEQLLLVTPWTLALVALVTLVSWSISAANFCWMIRRLGGQASWGRVFSINLGARLLNHLPAKPGTAWRALQYKRYCGVDYARYLSLGAVYSIINLLVTGLVLIVGILALRGALPGVVVGAAAAAGIVCLVALIAPWPRLSRSGRVAEFLRSAADGKSSLARPTVLIGIVVLVLVSLALSAGRFAIALRGVDVDQSWLACLALGAASTMALRVTITPAGLGTHELLVGGVAELVGLSLATGVLAAAVVRVVVLVLSLTLGGLALLAARPGISVAVDPGAAP